MRIGVLRTLKKRTPLLLSIAGVSGVVLTAVLAAKAAIKASTLLEKSEKETHDAISFSNRIKTVMPVYLPAVISGALTVSCIFGANLLNQKQQASLCSAYTLLSYQYKKYTDTVKKTLGENTHHRILETIAAEQAEDIPIYAMTFTGALQDFDDTQEEKRLFYDGFSDRYFESSFVHVLKAMYHINRNLCLGGDVTLNDFYLFLGISKIDGGDDIGWSWYQSEISWIDFENIKMHRDDGTEYYMICTPFGPEIFDESE